MTHQFRLVAGGDEWSSAYDPRPVRDVYDVDLGPLVNRGQLDKTEHNVEAARDDGATLLAGGKRPAGPDFQRGYWYEPTVFVDVDPAMPP